MEDKEPQSSLSFFTPNHSRHDSSWIFRGSSFRVVCAACLIETLEDRGAFAIRKRKSLTEILLLLSRDNKLVDILSKNIRISSHLCQVLVNLLESTYEGISQISLEGVVQLVFKLQSDVLVKEILEILESKILSLNNFRKICPFVVLIGKLVHTIPLLGEEIIAHKTKLWDYCISGLSFPDEAVVVALLFLILGVFKIKKTKESISVETKVKVFKRCCESLVNAKNTDLRINSLALLQCYTNFQDLESIKLLAGDKESRDIQAMLGNALKKLVLGTDQGLQIGGIQLATKLLSIDSAEKVLFGTLIRCGLAEFLFEALETNNDIVLASLFCCLTELCNSSEFFKGSYSIYGIDSVVSATIKAINLQNPETLQQGLHVLSTIISRQKKEVPLFSNGTIFDRCLMVSEECLKAMEYKVLKEALRLEKSLLRVDQLPSGFDITRMLSSLNGVVAVLKRFTSKTVESFSGMQSGTAQELLFDLLEVIYQVVDFTNNYSSKSPSLEEALLKDLLPVPNIATKLDLSQAMDDFVMKAIDETCITAVMVNYEAITNASVFEILFKLLNSQLVNNNNEKTVTFAKKLVHASFIRISMEISGRFCKGGSHLTLMKELQHFQSSLIIDLNKESSADERMVEILELAAVPGCPDEYLTLLSQSSLDPISLNVSDKMLFKIQCYCIELLYLSYTYNDIILIDRDLIRGIHKFICLNRNLCILPVQTLQHLVHLYSDITMRDQGERQFGFVESERIIQQELLKLKAEEFQAVSYTTSFVQWVFQSETLARAFGKCLLKNVISKDGKESISFVWKAFKNNKNAVKDLVSLLLSEDFIFVKKVSQTIENILDEDVIQHGGSQTVSSQVIGDELHKLFLRNQGMALPDHVLSAMLQILLSLQMNMGRDVDMKIFHLVVDVLSKTAHESPNITIAAVNYLNVELWMNMRSAKPGVAAVLLSNKEFVFWLQKVLTVIESQGFVAVNSTAVNVFGICIILLSNLVLSQSKFRISSTYYVTLNKGNLLGLLNDYHNHILQLSSLHFWKTFLDTRMKTFVIFGKERSTGETDSILTEIDFKVILVYLQNALMHESKAIRNCSLRCLHSLLTSDERRKSCATNPWNKVILDSFLFSLTQEKLDSELLQFCKVMMKANCFWNMEGPLTSAAAVILKEIPNIPLDLDDQGQLPLVAEHCIDFLQELVTSDTVLLSNADKLITWMNRLNGIAIKATPLKKLCFIKVDQVVLPEEIIADRLGVPNAHAVSEILQWLERINGTAKE